MAHRPEPIVIEIVGIEEGGRGRSCEEHAVCGSATALVQAESTGGLRGSYVCKRGKSDFFGILGGLDRGGFRNRASDFDSSARSHTSTIPQSTSDCVGGGVIDWGIAWQLCLQVGEI